MDLSPFKSIAVSENHHTFAGEIDFEETEHQSSESDKIIHSCHSCNSCSKKKSSKIPSRGEEDVLE